MGPRHLVRSLGKELTHYQGIDCGAFYCQPEVAEFSLRLDPEDSSRLSQIMQQLADQQRLQAVLHRHYWQDIDTPRSEERRVGKEWRCRLATMTATQNGEGETEI